MRVVCEVCFEVIGETGINPDVEAFVVCAGCKKKEKPDDPR